ncbi:uncharacterized protein ACJ7VT_012225 [Polymixia lowei]
MNSRNSAYSQRQQYGDRSTRQWNEHEDRWRERQGHHNGMLRDSYPDYGEEAHTSKERTRGNREYSDSPKRLYSKESFSEDWSKGSQVRRRHCASNTPDKDVDLDRDYATFRQFSTESRTSQAWGTPEKRQRRLTEDVDDNLKYRQPHEDYKPRPPPQEEFKYRKTAKESKRRQRPEEFTYRKPPEDFMSRQSSGYNKDRHFQDGKQHRRQSQEFPSRVYDKARDGNDRPSWPDNEAHSQTRTRFPENQFSEQVFETEHTVNNHGLDLAESIAEHNLANKGFQRFLHVLNKGVDVDMLTKIVGRTPAVAEDPLYSPTSPPNTADPLGSRSSARRQDSHQNTPHWNESRGSQREAAPQQHHGRLISGEQRRELHNHKEPPRDFQRCSLSDEKSLQRNDTGAGHFSSSSRSGSPPGVEETTVRPKDEHKCRQMQDLLQAIGMDFGVEELGQVSNRIQERLYGKKNSERREVDKERKKESRQVFTPRYHSRSPSSGRSSFGPLPQRFSQKKDSAPKDVVEVHQTAEHAYTSDNSSTVSVQDVSQESSVGFNSSFSPDPTYALPEPPPTPVMPPYPAAQYSPYAYSPAASAFPPTFGITVGTMPSLPYIPVCFPYPRFPTLNACQSAAGQSNTFLQGTSNRQLMYLNLREPKPFQPLNTTQKTMSRPRCLQVIETEKPRPKEETTQDQTKYLIENVVEFSLRELLNNQNNLRIARENAHQVLLKDTTERPNEDDGTMDQNISSGKMEKHAAGTQGTR